MPRKNFDATGAEVTRTPETEGQYRDRVRCLLKRSSALRGVPTEALSATDLFADFVTTSSSYARRTVNYDRAALLHIADRMEAQGRWTRERADQARAQLDGPLACHPNPPARTSAKKRKEVRDGELDHLFGNLTSSNKPADLHLHWLVAFGLIFAMRPVEWWDSAVDDGELVVINAKATNRRSHGVSRQIPLRQLDDCERDELGQRGGCANSFETKDDWRGELKRLSSRLHYVCDNLGIPRLALTTFRHVGLALFKRDEGAVAAGYLAGHKNDRTCRTHYARSSTAPKSLKARIAFSEDAISAVVRTGRGAPRRRSRKPKKQ